MTELRDCAAALGEAPGGRGELDVRLDDLLRQLGALDAGVRDRGAGAEVVDSVDAYVLARLEEEVAANGFPRRTRISHEASGALLAVIWHNARRSPDLWTRWVRRLGAALHTGDARPREYAEMVDAYAVRYAHRLQTYNTLPGARRDADAAAVTERRLSIGLLPEGWGAEEVAEHCGCGG